MSATLATHIFNGQPYVIHSEAAAAGYFMKELMGIYLNLYPLVNGKLLAPDTSDLTPHERNHGKVIAVDDWAVPMDSWKNYLLNFTLNDLSPMTGQPASKYSRKRSYRTYIIEALGSDLVKIGRAGDCQARLKQLQTAQACELRILKDHPEDIEAVLHGLFATARVKGEWFRYTQAIKDWLSVN